MASRREKKNQNYALPEHYELLNRDILGKLRSSSRVTRQALEVGDPSLQEVWRKEYHIWLEAAYIT